MTTLVVFIILVSYVPFSQFIAPCHGNQKDCKLCSILSVYCLLYGNQKERIWPIRWPKNVKRHFLHIHISNNKNFDSDLYMLKHYSSNGVD